MKSSLNLGNYSACYSFIAHGDPDWEWIREKIQASPVEHK